MFAPNEYFKAIPCPARDICTLPNCLFSHERRRWQKQEEAAPIAKKKRARDVVPEEANKATKVEEPTSSQAPPPVQNTESAETTVLAPEFLPISPAAHATRHSLLQLIHKEYVRLGHPTPKRYAILKELEFARSSTKQTYGMAVKQFIQKLRAATSLNPPKPAPQRGQKEVDQIRRLVAPKDRLELYGYILEPPGYFDGVDSGWEKCDRCWKDFDRQEQRECAHHFGRMAKLGSDRVYSCCHGTQGAPPCCHSPRHVFRVANKERLHKLIPFVQVRQKSPHEVVAMDCEMVYTALGSEIARVTIVDMNGKILMDELCLPMGDIWDLGTRYSGITSLDDVTTTFQELRSRVLQIIGFNTVVILHGGDNDMAALRLLHDRVVDTAVVYSHPRGPPFRYSLRDLVKRYLGRDIQQGGGKALEGHDSVEDSKATLNLVLKTLSNGKA